MKALKWTLGFTLALLVGTAFAQIVTRPLDPRTGQSAGVTYFKAASEPSCNVGEVGVRLNSSGDHELVVCQENTGWEGFVELDGGDAITGTQDFSGNVTFDGNVTLGNSNADDITVNGPVFQNVFREDFDFVSAKYIEFDFTASVLTDAGHNVILMPGSQIGVIGWITESSDGLAAQPEVFGTRGVLDMSSLADDVNNDAVELAFGSWSPVNTIGLQSTVLFDEDDDESSYCEVSLAIADISELDDFWFGWRLQEDAPNPPASDTTNTMAYFVISDNAGDLDIETELNAGGTLNDDTGVTWADGITHVLRVTVDSDAVTFTLDGAAVTQTNAVLNFDATDRGVCVLGYTLVTGDGTPEPGVTLQYVEIGVNGT